jgi:hypothetical protein
MSFQRIFELVRRQGMPLVVTDEAGKQPLVVLPFDMYEALMEGDGHASRDTRHATPTKEPVPVPRMEQLAKEEISLEERFYVETPEDQENR